MTRLGLSPGFDSGENEFPIPPPHRVQARRLWATRTPVQRLLLLGRKAKLSSVSCLEVKKACCCAVISLASLFLGLAGIVVIATRLMAGRSGVRIPVATRDFSLFLNAHTGSGARLVSRDKAVGA